MKRILSKLGKIGALVATVLIMAIIVPVSAYAVTGSISATIGGSTTVSEGSTGSCSLGSTCNSVTITWSAGQCGTQGSYITLNGSYTVPGTSDSTTSHSGSTSVSILSGTNTFELFCGGTSTDISGTHMVVTINASNAPTPTPTPNPLQMSNLSVSPTINSAVVTWTTNLNANAAVSYGPSNYNGYANDSTMTTSHSVTLTNLTGGTTYHFNAQSTDANGDLIGSGDQTFITHTNSTSSSSNPTPTPIPSSSGSTSTSNTTTNTSANTLTSANGTTGSTSNTTASETPAPTGTVLGASTSAITPTPTVVTEAPKQTTNKSKSIPFYLIAATGIMIFVTGLLLQMAGVVKIGILEKILRFLLGL